VERNDQKRAAIRARGGKRADRWCGTAEMCGDKSKEKKECRLGRGDKGECRTVGERGLFFFFVSHSCAIAVNDERWRYERREREREREIRSETNDRQRG
jgi:hypothetical protein